MVTPMPPSARWHWRQLRVLLYLFLGLVVLDLLVASQRRRWRDYDPDDYRERVRACRTIRPELLFVGGSPVSEGIDPTLIAPLSWHGQSLENVCNLGLPGATTSEVWHAVKCGAVAPPRLLVYGITASDLNDSRNEPHGQHSLMGWDDLPRWILYRPRSAEWGVRHFLQGRLTRLWQLYAFRNGIRLWAADQLDHYAPGLCPEAAAEARDGLRYSAALRSGHGYAPRPNFQVGRLDLSKAAGVPCDSFSFLQKYRLGEHLRYLEHLREWARLHGVAVVLVDMPISADLEQRLYPQEFAVYRAALTDLEQRGVCILHARREAIGLMDADFADLAHLNARGNARLSTWLRSSLECLGGRP